MSTERRRPRDLEQFYSFYKELPSDISNAGDELGNPLTLHKPDTNGIIANLILGIAFLVLGVGIWGYHMAE